MAKNRTIPLSILIAGIIISGSVLHSRDFSFNFFGSKKDQAEITDIRPVGLEEPILGNPEAPIVFVEYSDIECPICISFARERDRIMSIYGESGKVAWVYRGVSTMGAVSRQKALALECVADESNDHRFWRYLREIQSLDITSPETGAIDTKLLTVPLEKIELSAEKVAECIDEQRYLQKLQNNIKEARVAGAERTPFIVILLSERISPLQEEKIKVAVEKFPANLFTIPTDTSRLIINGSMPANNITEIIEILLTKQ